MKDAAQGMPVKPILQFWMVKTDSKRIKIVKLIDEVGFPCIKNSSGGGPLGIAVKPKEIKLLINAVSGTCKLKVSGKGNLLEKMVSLFDAETVLVGTSSGIEIINRSQWNINNY